MRSSWWKVTGRGHCVGWRRIEPVSIAYQAVHNWNCPNFLWMWPEPLLTSYEFVLSASPRPDDSGTVGVAIAGARYGKTCDGGIVAWSTPSLSRGPLPPLM